MKRTKIVKKTDAQYITTIPISLIRKLGIKPDFEMVWFENDGTLQSVAIRNDFDLLSLPEGVTA